MIKRGDLVVVSHWRDFDTRDAVAVGRFDYWKDGYFYIQESMRGYKFCRRVVKRNVIMKDKVK